MTAYLDSMARSARFADAVELFRARFEQELESIRGVGPASDRGQEVVGAAIRLVEALVGGIQLEINSERSALVVELASASARVEHLERQLDDTLRLLLDAQRHRKPHLVRSGLLALAGFFAGIGTGVGEGVGGALFDQVSGSGGSAVSLEYSVSCYALDQALDDRGVYSPVHPEADGAENPEAPEPEAGSNDESPDDFDAIDEDPWLTAPADLGPEYLVWKEAGFQPLEAVDWTVVGFGVDEALRWVAYGVTASEARAWVDRSRESSSLQIEPADAAAFRESEFSPNEAMAWRDYGFDADEAADWRMYDFDPEEAVDWLDEGFDAESADRWRDEQLTPDSARLNLGDDND